MKLIWLERALVDQDNILDYITERDDEAAENLHAAIDACSRRIEQHPFMYRPVAPPARAKPSSIPTTS